MQRSAVTHVPFTGYDSHRSQRIPALNNPRAGKVIPQDPLSDGLQHPSAAAKWFCNVWTGARGHWTLAHTILAETNDSNLTVVSQAEVLRHSCLFKPLKMTQVTFTVCAWPSFNHWANYKFDAWIPQPAHGTRAACRSSGLYGGQV